MLKLINKIIPYKPYLKDIARELRKKMTIAEVLLWQEIRDKKILGYKFFRQKPIDNYIVDFYCRDLQLVIEVDGKTHDNDETIEKDFIRQNRLESLGVQFLRFNDQDVKDEIESVLYTIRNWIMEHK